MLRRLTEKEIHLVTVTSVIGRGRQQGVAEIYRSHKEPGNLLKKIKLKIAVNDEYVEPAVEAITGGAISGNLGDGRIFIMDLSECIRIRTGEKGNAAIG